MRIGFERENVMTVRRVVANEASKRREGTGAAASNATLATSVGSIS